MKYVVCVGLKSASAAFIEKVDKCYITIETGSEAILADMTLIKANDISHASINVCKYIAFAYNFIKEIKCIL